jgi:sugar porter (SP) family MFS transporter
MNSSLGRHTGVPVDKIIAGKTIDATPVKINSALIGATLVGALGGLLFGFDTAVISGCQADLVKLFTLTSGQQGFMTASAMLGATVGSLAAAKPGDLYGRRDCLKIVAAFYLLCAIGCAFSSSLTMIVAARFLGGVAVGASSVLGPMYLAEIAPASWRGRLVACFQVNIVLGVLIAYGSNFFLGSMGLGAIEWRWKLGVQAVPAFVFLAMLFFIPRSPRWLMMKGKREEAAVVLGKIGVADVPSQMSAIQESLREEILGKAAPLFVRSLRKPVLLAITIAMFNQLGGINALWYYADQIFAMAGFDKHASAMQSVILGAVNLISTLVGMAIIDKVGRKPLLICGSIGGAISLGLVAWIFNSNVHADWLVWLLGRHGDLPCVRTRRGDLGVHQRNISQPRPQQRPDLGQFYPLVHGDAHLGNLPDGGTKSGPARRRTAVCLLFGDDGHSNRRRVEVFPGNETGGAGGHATTSQALTLALVDSQNEYQG